MGTHLVLKRTALNSVHRTLGARMVDFAGWDMPVQYAGPVAEHLAVRTSAGLFDVSHMGELELRGLGAERTLQRVTCNDVALLPAGSCQYSAITTPQGTFVDDILVYRMGENHFFLCVNASNQTKDYDWICDNSSPGTEVIFRSEDFAQLALQGPRSQGILQALTESDLSLMKYYHFAQCKISGIDSLVSRTGYTGEDGFEIYVHPDRAEWIWNRIMESGKPSGIQPAGLAARNTLRLEARMALYGHDIDETTSVLEADLGWICKLDKGEFIGRSALLKQRDEGVARKLVGFEMTGRGIARDQYPVEMNGRTVGLVTSGSPAPFLRKNIGLVYLPSGQSSPGTGLEVIIRGKRVPARVVPTPFYKRSKAA